MTLSDVTPEVLIGAIYSHPEGTHYRTERLLEDATDYETTGVLRPFVSYVQLDDGNQRPVGTKYVRLVDNFLKVFELIAEHSLPADASIEELITLVSKVTSVQENDITSGKESSQEITTAKTLAEIAICETIGLHLATHFETAASYTNRTKLEVQDAIYQLLTRSHHDDDLAAPLTAIRRGIYAVRRTRFSVVNGGLSMWLLDKPVF